MLEDLFAINSFELLISVTRLVSTVERVASSSSSPENRMQALWLRSAPNVPGTSWIRGAADVLQPEIDQKNNILLGI